MTFTGFVGEGKSGAFDDSDNIQSGSNGSGSDRGTVIGLIVGQADSSCNSRGYGIVEAVTAVD